MKILFRVILIVLALLSASAGLAKMLKVPQEVEFLQGVGFTENSIVLFGLAQVVAGVLLVFPKTRTIGAIFVALTMAVSVATLFMAGKTGFALFSLLPVALATAVAVVNAKSATADASSRLAAD